MIDFESNTDLPADLAKEREASWALFNDVEKRVAAHRLTQLTEEPKCHRCQAGVLAPSCKWADCPRGQILDMYGGYRAVVERLEDISPDVGFVLIEAESQISFIIKIFITDAKSGRVARCHILEGDGRRWGKHHALFDILRATFAPDDEDGDWNTVRKFRNQTIDWTEGRSMIDYANDFIRLIELPLSYTSRLSNRNGT
jgi:hypothetical protein